LIAVSKPKKKERKEKGAEISISLLYQKKESVCSLHLQSLFYLYLKILEINALVNFN
jgi:hypothetical protein